MNFESWRRNITRIVNPINISLLFPIIQKKKKKKFPPTLYLHMFETDKDAIK